MENEEKILNKGVVLFASIIVSQQQVLKVNSRKTNQNYNHNRKYNSYQMTAGSGSWRTMMNPMATRMRAKLTRTIRQQTPRVLGQNWKEN
jgi:hypothetical protein